MSLNTNEEKELTAKAMGQRRSVWSREVSATLKLALLIIIGLIAAIIIGVGIGYLAASRGLIKI